MDFVDAILITDINGNSVLIHPDEIAKAIMRSRYSIYGVDVSAIKTFRKFYTKAGGKLPITKQNVTDFFKQIEKE